MENNFNRSADYKKHIFTDFEISEKVKTGEFAWDTLLTINETSGSKRYVLNFAARHGYMNTLAALRDAGLTGEQIDQTFPLFTAAKNNQIAAMEALMRMDEGTCNLNMEVQIRENGKSRFYPNMLFYFFDVLPKVSGRVREGHIRAFWSLVYYGINICDKPEDEVKNRMGYSIIDLIYLNRVKPEVNELIDFAVLFFGFRAPALNSIEDIKEFFEEIECAQLQSVVDSYGFEHCFA